MTVRLFMRENNCYESDDHNRTYYGGDRSAICGRCAGEYTDEKYDMYYLKDRVNIEKLRQVLQIYVFDDDFMCEKSGKDITKRLKTIFADMVYIARLVNSDKKWIDADVSKITAGLVELAEKI